MPKMRAAQIVRPNGPFEIVEREIPQPAAGWVRIKVQACGICHSDSLVKEGLWPGLQYPRVPGHEVDGTVDAVGAGVSQWKPGQRVGAGWHGGHCGHCDACRSGNFFGCQVALQITGISFDGGYADYMLAPAMALALVPEDLSAVEAAPLMCAGITTYNALRNSGARPGDVVAVLGLGGLGHLGVQYAVKMGFKTVGIARGRDKEPLARELGAHHAGYAYVQCARGRSIHERSVSARKSRGGLRTDGERQGKVPGGAHHRAMMVFSYGTVRSGQSRSCVRISRPCSRPGPVCTGCVARPCDVFEDAPISVINEE